MKTIFEELSSILNAAFEEAGVSSRVKNSPLKPIEVSYSRRPDLCDFQCNEALKLSKVLEKKPIEIAEIAAENLRKHPAFKSVTAEHPGFINMTLSSDWMSNRLNSIEKDARLGFEQTQTPLKYLVDFGGANVAKSLHVGHLRSAVIGESLIRLLRFKGHDVTGDIHLGDWGLQMGYVIEMVRLMDATLPYFSEEAYEVYPLDAPFDIHLLTELYTTANIKSKTDDVFKAQAAQSTAELQNGNKGYLALWKHILKVSKADLEKNYGALQVHFDLWYGESDSQTAIPKVWKILENQGLLVNSENADVVHVVTEEDTKPMPPCIIRKANGAALYATTDLATIYQRVQDKALDGIIYVVDKRQDLHFEQVFRVARMSGIANKELSLEFIGFGTMNGKDGKPFKTRDGGVMALGDLINLLIEGVKEKMNLSDHLDEDSDKNEIALAIGVGALKFADLSNQPVRDYVFDIDQFASFEGKTGPYLQYSIVRINSILNKLNDLGINRVPYQNINSPAERKLVLKLIEFSSWVALAIEHYQPSKVCDFAFELAQGFNVFYHDVHVLSETPERQGELKSLLEVTKRTLEKSLWLLGINVLEKM